MKTKVNSGREGELIPQPEQQARNTIDSLLAQAGWAVCDPSKANIHGSRGVAIREFPPKPSPLERNVAMALLAIPGVGAHGLEG